MISVDTNVIIRFVVDDDIAQSQKARSFFESLAREETLCFVSDIVVCEIVWVLQSCYRFSRSEIASTLKSLLRTRELRFQSPDLVSRAIDRYEDGKGDLADYLIDEVGRSQGSTATATFDGGLRNDDRFIQL